ncbi:MAG: amidohydrolase family protein [Jiangellales bacterium]
MVIAPASQPLHLRGVVLPDEQVRDLWVVDGVVATEPVDGATTITPAGTASEPSAWIIPGMVDLHCHVGLALHGAVPDDEAERQALADRDAGVLLLRDAGSPADTRWMDERADLPRVVRAGRHIARTRRYMRNYGHEIEPEQLREYVAAEAQRGDGWVKLVGDWIDRDTGDLGPCWPRWALDEAMATAHEHGARVTAHVFGEEALADLVGAGIDCIEHATGLRDVDDGRLVDDMARRGVAIVPTLINIDNFDEFAAAGEAKFPGYAEHMRRLQAGSRRNVAEAFEAGVPVYAGTDAGGQLAHGLLGHEVVSLAEAGLPGESAVAAGSWEARRFLLGDPPDGDFFAPGTSADLVVLADDPRRSPGTLLGPLVVMLRGRVVG